MLLKYFYDSTLAHASYMVGCQRTGEAVIVDPGRHIEQYLDEAARQGVRVTAVAETHIHADYVSGARELADRVGAKLYVSDCGPTEWKYEYAKAYDHQLLLDGDTFAIGNIEFEVMHTPGHTPESISFLLTDRGSGAATPMGIFTGDFVFVGSIGRPDLLEEAAGIMDTAEQGARDLFESIKRFRKLDPHLQVWPAHGAGSACGKGLGAIPSTTVGYEKLYNPALQFDNEDEFVEYVLADQPEAPKYFAVMKHVNKVGPQILGEGHRHRMLGLDQFDEAIAAGVVIDLRPAADFASGHVPGSINIPVPLLSPWAGWLVDYKKPTYLICHQEELEVAARILHAMGCDRIAGGFDAEAVVASGRADEVYTHESPDSLSAAIRKGNVHLVDVRSHEEWNEGHIEQAHHHFLGRLPDTVDNIPSDAQIVTQCQIGARAAIAASVLQALGYKNVVNLAGGYAAWLNAGLPSVQAEVECSA